MGVQSVYSFGAFLIHKRGDMCVMDKISRYSPEFFYGLGK
jgi:hypothetical protein